MTFWPQSSPGMLFSVAGPPFQGWTLTPWPFPEARLFSFTPCPLPSFQGSLSSTSAPDVVRCSGRALILAVSSQCFRRSCTFQTRTMNLLQSPLHLLSRIDCCRVSLHEDFGIQLSYPVGTHAPLHMEDGSCSSFNTDSSIVFLKVKLGLGS